MSHDQTLRVLIVEDEALLAMDLEAVIEDEGHTVVAEAASRRHVRNLTLPDGPHIAFVDLHLAEGSSGLDVFDDLRKRWPETVVVFVTANPTQIEDDFPGAFGVVAKPFSRHGMTSVVRYLSEAVLDPPPDSAVPATIRPLPAMTAAWPVD